MERPINKTMNRDDLFAPEAAAIVDDLNTMIRALREKGVFTTSWYGSLPEKPSLWRRWMGRGSRHPCEEPVGLPNRGPDYEALPGAADDARLPWYLYWEIAWLLRHGPTLTESMRVLDAGGTSSLFTCYLAWRGYEIHSIDLNPDLVENADNIARVMGWRMHSYAMNVAAMDHFHDECFDHAYSVCVFEHLDHATKQAALRQIARCLKPGGNLSITIDYRNPAPFVTGFGSDRRSENRLSTPADLHRAFVSSGAFRLIGNEELHDDGTSWLVHPKLANGPYTFAALFLRKV